MCELADAEDSLDRDSPVQLVVGLDDGDEPSGLRLGIVLVQALSGIVHKINFSSKRHFNTIKNNVVLKAKSDAYFSVPRAWCAD